jgi:hypothetical protein
MMRIEDLPRPWLLAAMTGVPMAALLEQAEREQAEQAERAWQRLLGEQYRRAWSATDRPAVDPRVRLKNLAS